MIKQISPEERLLNIIKGKQARQRVIKRINLKFALNTFLLLLIIILAAYLVFIFLKKENTSVAKRQIQNPDFKKLDDIKNTEVLLASQKNIFGSNQPEDLGGEPGDFDVNLQDKITKQFVLVGIMEQNQAIIEDKINNKTFFLHKGQVAAGLKVKEINTDKIILDVQGQEVELVL